MDILWFFTCFFERVDFEMVLLFKVGAFSFLRPRVNFLLMILAAWFYAYDLLLISLHDVMLEWDLQLVDFIDVLLDLEGGESELLLSLAVRHVHDLFLSESELLLQRFVLNWAEDHLWGEVRVSLSFDRFQIFCLQLLPERLLEEVVDGWVWLQGLVDARVLRVSTLIRLLLRKLSYLGAHHCLQWLLLYDQGAYLLLRLWLFVSCLVRIWTQFKMVEMLLSEGFGRSRLIIFRCRCRVPLLLDYLDNRLLLRSLKLSAATRMLRLSVCVDLLRHFWGAEVDGCARDERHSLIILLGSWWKNGRLLEGRIRLVGVVNAPSLLYVLWGAV